MLTQSQLEALLGRPLTPVEVTNLDMYLDIAQKRLSNLLCFSFSTTEGTRIYDTRDGYRNVYIDPFTGTPTVTVDGHVREGDWIKKQNDDYNADWFNVIEFDEPLCGERIEVTATWGFETLPNDLAPLLAGLFGIQQAELQEQGVKVKVIEDFRVEYTGSAAYDSLVLSQESTIRKYAQCERAVRHEPVRPIYYY